MYTSSCRSQAGPDSSCGGSPLIPQQWRCVYPREWTTTLPVAGEDGQCHRESKGTPNLFLLLLLTSLFFPYRQGNDIAARIYQKKELGCQANGFTTVEEGQRREVFGREKDFLDLLNAKKGFKGDHLALKRCS